MAYLSRKFGILALLFMFILILSVSSFAHEDFDTRSSATIHACACSSEQVPMTIENTGYLKEVIRTLDNGPDEVRIKDMQSGYHITASGSAAAFFELEYPLLQLSTGEEATIYGYIHAPCDAEGLYDLQIDIRTDEGTHKRLSQSVEIFDCPNIRLSAAATSKAANPCGEAVYSFDIGNTGSFTERYTIGIDKLKDAVTFSENPVQISSGSSRTVFMHVDLDCYMLDDSIINLKVKADKSGYYAKLPFLLDVNDTYFDYDIRTSADRYEVCQSSLTHIPVEFSNHALDDSDLYLFLKGGDFASLSDDELIVPASGRAYANVTIDSDDVKEGTYALEVSARSAFQHIEKKRSFDIDVVRCHGLSYDADDIRINYTDGTISINVENAASKPQDYVFSFEGPEWISISSGLDDSDGRLSLEAGESREITFSLSHDRNTSAGRYRVYLMASLEDDPEVYYADSFRIILDDGKGWLSWLSSPRAIMVVLGITDLAILLLVLIAFSLAGNKRKKGGQKTLDEINKTQKKKAAKPKKKMLDIESGKDASELCTLKINIPKVILAIIIIAAVIAGSFWLYGAFTGNDNIPADAMDNTTASPDDSVAQVPDAVPVEEAAGTEPIDEAGDVSVSEGKIKGYLSAAWQKASPALATIYTYRWYIISAIVLIAAIIILVWALRRKSLSREISSEDAKKILESKPASAEDGPVFKRERRFHWFRWLLLVLVISAALAGVYYYGEDGFSKFAHIASEEESNLTAGEDIPETDIGAFNNITEDYGPPEDTAENETEDAEAVIVDEIAEDITEVLLPEDAGSPTSEDIEALDGPVIIWEKNTEYLFDLNSIFSDPDGDILEFSVSNVRNVTAELDLLTGIVTLVPEPDWTGISAVWFTADDGKGGISTTDKIYLAVVEPEHGLSDIAVPVSGALGVFNAFVKEYLYYIIIGIIILVIIILVTRYNKHLMEFFDEESPEDYMNRIDKDAGQEKQEVKKKAARKTTRKKVSKK